MCCEWMEGMSVNRRTEEEGTGTLREEASGREKERERESIDTTEM